MRTSTGAPPVIHAAQTSLRIYPHNSTPPTRTNPISNSDTLSTQALLAIVESQNHFLTVPRGLLLLSLLYLRPLRLARCRPSLPLSFPSSSSAFAPKTPGPVLIFSGKESKIKDEAFCWPISTKVEGPHISNFSSGPLWLSALLIRNC